MKASVDIFTGVFIVLAYNHQPKTMPENPVYSGELIPFYSIILFSCRRESQVFSSRTKPEYFVWDHGILY
jgi:hypothetical protein